MTALNPPDRYLIIAVQDSAGYRFHFRVGVMETLGDICRSISVDAYGGKLITPEDLTFMKKPLYSGDKWADVKIVDYFFDVLSLLLASDMAEADADEKAGKNAFADTKIIINTSLTLLPKTEKPEKQASDFDTALLFPGQGAQSVGMGKVLIESGIPGVRDIFDRASKVLGYDMLQLCLEGPAEKLQDTLFCQPAIVTVSLAAVEYMRVKHPEAIHKARHVAGFSLGEFSALVFSGALEFEDALKIVIIRATAMKDCTTRGPPGGMVSISGVNDDDLRILCEEAVKRHPGSICEVANFMFPGGRVVSCDKTVQDWVLQEARRRGAENAKALVVGGAFHSPRMAHAKDALRAALEAVTVSAPRVSVYSNVTGRPYESAAQIKELLPEQLVRGVQWEATMRLMMRGEDAPRRYFETGPGRQLRSMLRRIDQAAFKASSVIKV
uniref:Malonyl-CoA:ACP transacylase (MAT) domain-containing protein n=1 Tax=Octactis speculum TaxID=3111310 RepID=A0A7S2AH80_9STRA|mmetsp:Transcript_10012/g.13071  ORF Transcript_10012/g.13071 Transcript_10012/m.13071 type:complete len:440 (+) Transcript_10012:77-1396(+)|eukprot:CAMPEP_0185780812 /NCGR_PEP_ID=MMETSP1174-20130828/100232_1 /TAXON_ID=35687 /ORGANISM="Dictyocha speculum, Strain CCMP1381" /LENGTH=439 /DNA_ID=CAMNT_0028470507 /DNA_START=76 /DNA_END=1395 /DNA_ORIENTATION=-